MQRRIPTFHFRFPVTDAPQSHNNSIISVSLADHTCNAEPNSFFESTSQCLSSNKTLAHSMYLSFSEISSSAHLAAPYLRLYLYGSRLPRFLTKLPMALAAPHVATDVNGVIPPPISFTFAPMVIKATIVSTSSSAATRVAMRSSAIHREREREREKEVKKCQNSRSFEHLLPLKEGDTQNSIKKHLVASSSLSGRSRRSRGPKMQRKRSVDIVDTTPLPGRDLRGPRRSFLITSRVQRGKHQ